MKFTSSNQKERKKPVERIYRAFLLAINDERKKERNALSITSQKKKKKKRRKICLTNQSEPVQWFPFRIFSRDNKKTAEQRKRLALVDRRDGNRREMFLQAASSNAVHVLKDILIRFLLNLVLINNQLIAGAKLERQGPPGGGVGHWQVVLSQSRFVSTVQICRPPFAYA